MRMGLICSVGETKSKKPMAMIVAAHGIKYTATATIGYHVDLKRKVKRACDSEDLQAFDTWSS
jgi:pyruvate/2-oxoacid:ferredoxin oxidoreductase beta subunit